MGAVAATVGRMPRLGHLHARVSVAALVAVFTSWYLSKQVFEFMRTLCALCWYQSIPMVGVAVVLVLAAVRRDGDRARAYGLPLVVIGLLLTLYHDLVEWGVGSIPRVCGATVHDCRTKGSVIAGLSSLSMVMSLAYLALLALLLFAPAEQSGAVPVAANG
jgi:disulfide bond formation protein DsbB